MIEDILKEIVAEKTGIVAVVMLKANKGYSVVPVSKTEYSERFLLDGHWNGATVLEALEDMWRDMKGE